jgi:diguanylate cyclase (GGDEF)-like protein
VPGEPPPLPGHPRYAIEHFGERFGLGAATIESIAQDAQGFLWIGTHTGVFRYDGESIRHFGRDEGLPGERVKLILTPPDGQVWVRTTKGISRFGQSGFNTLSLPEGTGALPDVYQSFAVDNAGTLFICTQRGLLQIGANGTRYLVFGEAGTEQPVHMQAVVSAPSGAIWFATDTGIGFFPAGSPNAHFISSLDLSADPVVALLPTADHKLWIRTASRVGIVELAEAATEPVWMSQPLPRANGMGGPRLDHSGKLLLPTNLGLYRWTGQEWQLIDHRNGLTSNATTAVLEDREGGIWIGAAGGGVDHWPGSKQWSGWTDTEGLPDALVLGVVRDQRDRLWVATNTSLSIWDPTDESWHWWTDNGLSGAGVTQVLLAPDGGVWAAFGSKGLYRFDAAASHPGAERVPMDTREFSTFFPRIAVAPNGSVWTNGNNRLFEIQYEKGQFHIREQTVPAEQAGTSLTVSISPDGVLWTAGLGGLFRLVGGQWQRFEKKDGLLATTVTRLKAIAGDEVWIGYPDEGATTRFRVATDGHTSVQHVPHGLCSLGMDARQMVWLEMDVGIGIVPRDAAVPNDALRVFTRHDGLLWDDVNCDAMWQERDGSILIGTSKGLARYDPGEEAQVLPPPEVVITSAVFGKTERLHDQNPQIRYADRSFLARFAAPIFRDPERVTCRHRLSPVETDFTGTTTREVRYPLLPAGSYRFEVNCGSPGVGWSETATYPFVIRAAWWQTWPSMIGYAGVLVLAILAFVQYRTRRDRQARRQLELAVAERSAELATANRELEEASLTDHLTGVRNRRFFHAMIAPDASQVVRSHQGPSFNREYQDLILYVIDIDHFKTVNDDYGHDAGDRLLVEIGRRLDQLVRKSDFLIRWGGEEFVVVCRFAQRENATILAERILIDIGGQDFDLGNGRVVRKTCSVGWASYPWMPPEKADLSVEQVLRLADHGLYLAKRKGRNQAIGILPANSIPPSHRRYRTLEELQEDGILVEFNTPGPAVRGATPPP